MSAKREKKIRQDIYRIYERAVREWEKREPPKWRIISHYIWKREKPVMKAYGVLEQKYRFF